jgi:hypothetical protein
MVNTEPITKITFQNKLIMKDSNNPNEIDDNIGKFYPKNTLGVTQISTGFTNSGSLNGSLSNNIRPDVYNYTNYDGTKGESEDSRKEFDLLMERFLDHTKVNGVSSLRDYLLLCTNNNQTAIINIHEQLPQRPKGTAISRKPILLFTGADSIPKYSIPLYNVNLSGIGVSEMYQFLKSNGSHFSSEIPDGFFQKYYFGKSLTPY